MNFNFQKSLSFRERISLNYTSKEQSFQKFALFRVSKGNFILFSFDLLQFTTNIGYSTFHPILLKKDFVRIESKFRRDKVLNLNLSLTLYYILTSAIFLLLFSTQIDVNR